MLENYLAIDIGGSKIVVGIVNAEGAVLQANKQVLPQTYDIDYIIETVLRLTADLGTQEFAAAGVTIPGLADPVQGIWKYAPFSGIGEVPIAALLEKELKVPVFIENDVNACAVGEKAFGVCRDDDDFLWITVSNGVGGALYLNGALYAGTSGNAGEIGHLIVEENTDALCGCGRKGCLEAMASGKGIEKMYGRLYGKHLTAQEIAALADAGDVQAKHVFDLAGHYIGKAIAACINLLNLKKIVLGGGVIQSFHLLENAIHTALERYVFRQGNKACAVEKTGLGYYAALIGAAAIAQKGLQ